MSHVFVSYVREDAREVDRLVRQLSAADIDVWRDRESIRPGDRWKDVIRTAIQTGAFFIACFSQSYFNRDRTYMNEELMLAIDELRLRPRERAWFLPLLMDACEVPGLPIVSNETLRDIHAIQFDEDGVKQLIAVIATRVEKRVAPTPGEEKRQKVESKKSKQEELAEAIEDKLSGGKQMKAVLDKMYLSGTHFKQ
jgi:hypothetical protein